MHLSQLQTPIGITHQWGKVLYPTQLDPESLSEYLKNNYSSDKIGCPITWACHFNGGQLIATYLGTKMAWTIPQDGPIDTNPDVINTNGLDPEEVNAKLHLQIIRGHRHYQSLTK